MAEFTKKGAKMEENVVSGNVKSLYSFSFPLVITLLPSPVKLHSHQIHYRAC
jgi:hypothetical protein